MFLPVLFSGIYFLGRRGAVGEAETLQTKGIYRYVRNPMYSGVSNTIIGVGFLFDKPGVVFSGFIWLVMTIIQSRREEKQLERRFGEEYVIYKKNTAMFFPFNALIRGMLHKRED